jgi:ribosome biogenesis GTPase / thiamine phosphate phosphatase
MIDLADLGWDAARDAEWATLSLSDVVPGRVALEHNHVYRVLTVAGEVLAEASGRMKHRAGGRHELPAVGDWVAVRLDPRGHRTLIRAVLGRRSVFSRKAAGRETEEQVIAANIDVVFIVFGLDAPPKPRAIERYVVVARRSGAQPVVVLNKKDLHPDPTSAADDVRALVSGVPVHAVSAAQGDLAGLLDYLSRGRTVALLGPSGAGKSSLVNVIIGRELLSTGDVRDWDQRGRHTSVHRHLVVRAEGGLVIDTPGMRELQLWDADAALGDAFADVADLAGGCRFRDCRHDREPGCAVKAAVEDGRIDAERYEHFVRLSREQAETDQLRDERALLEEKRQSKIMGKALKSMQKDRGR